VKRLRIALVSEHASPLAEVGHNTDSGGQNIYVAQLARHLAQRGCEVDVYTRRTSPVQPDVVNWMKGVRVIHVQAGPAAEIPKEDLLPHMSQFAHGMLERICFEAIAYDLVHANFWLSGIAASLVKQWTHTPFVMTFHALGAIRRKHQGANDRFPPEREGIERTLAREAAAIIAECPQDRSDLLKYYQAPLDRMVTIPCGFDPGEMSPVDKSDARAFLRLPRDSYVLLQLGRMVRRKGIDTVISGYAAFVREHRPASAYLLIVGGDKQGRDPEAARELSRLQKLSRDEGVHNTVIFTGAQPRHRLRYYYSAADVFLTTPWYEPFGMTPLEAMACGTPVIGSNVGGIKYSVTEGETGWLVPPRDPQAVARSISMFHQYPWMVEQFGENALARVQSFAWQKVVEKILDLYESVVVQPAPIHTEGAGAFRGPGFSSDRS
jgi:D-inositol-3-phosphate glycosyltransferase